RNDAGPAVRSADDGSVSASWKQVQDRRLFRVAPRESAVFDIRFLRAAHPINSVKTARTCAKSLLDDVEIRPRLDLARRRIAFFDSDLFQKPAAFDLLPRYNLEVLRKFRVPIVRLHFHERAVLFSHPKPDIRVLRLPGWRFHLQLPAVDRANLVFAGHTARPIKKTQRQILIG